MESRLFSMDPKDNVPNDGPIIQSFFLFRRTGSGIAVVEPKDVREFI